MGDFRAANLLRRGFESFSTKQNPRDAAQVLNDPPNLGASTNVPNSLSVDLGPFDPYANTIVESPRLVNPYRMTWEHKNSPLQVDLLWDDPSSRRVRDLLVLLAGTFAGLSGVLLVDGVKGLAARLHRDWSP